MTPEQLNNLVEICFNLGVDYGRRIQANLENAIGLDSDMVTAAARGGAGLMQTKKDKQLDYEGIAFANSKPEIVEEYFKLLKNRTHYTEILHTIATELNNDTEHSS